MMSIRSVCRAAGAMGRCASLSIMLVVAGFVALLNSPEAWASDDVKQEAVIMEADAPCTLVNAEGETLRYAGSEGNGKIDTEMECFFKIYPWGLSRSACYLLTGYSDSFSISFDDGKARRLRLRVKGLDITIGSCSKITILESASGVVTAKVYDARGAYSFDDTGEYDIFLDGYASASAAITASVSRELFVARGVPEGEVSVDGVDTVDGTSRYYALGGELRATQKKWEVEEYDPELKEEDPESDGMVTGYERAATRIEGALPIKCGSAKSLRAGDARVTSELGGSAMWLNWDEVAGAKSYRVYEKRGKKWRKVALREGAGSSYALVRGAGAGAHRYRVRAFSDKAGKKPLGKAGFALSAVPSTDAARANADAVSLSKAKLSGRAGQAKRLKAAVSCAPGKRVLSKSVRWCTSDPKVAKVDKRGRVKLLKPGSCKVWAVAHDGVASAKADVVVRKGKAKKAAPAKRAKALGLMAAGF